MSPLGPRFLLAAGSALVAAAVGYALLPKGDSAAELFRKRAENVAPTPDSFRHGPIPEKHARAFLMALRDEVSTVYDEDVHFAYQPNLDRFVAFEEHEGLGYRLRTNERGLREDGPVLAAKPHLRVLVLGDSHTDGLVNNDESFPNVLESLLAEQRPRETVEVLNAGKAVHTFYNYLGGLEKYADLDPDLVVVAFYASNDFFEALLYRHYYDRTPIPEDWENYGSGETWREIAETHGMAAGAQAFSQRDYFRRFPGELPLAAETALRCCLEMTRLARERGFGLLFVAIPAAAVVEPQHHAERLGPIREMLGFGAEDGAVSARLTAELLGALRQQGPGDGSLGVFDAAEVLGGAAEPHYWKLDFHLNVRGHRILAEALAELLRPWSPR